MAPTTPHDPKAPTSPSLEVISSPGAGPDPQGGERRRLPRINLSGEQFRLSQTGKIFSVTDLSLGGMALRILDRSDFLLFPVATRFEGTLNLKGEKHALEVRVRHIGPANIGCEFEELTDSARAALMRFLDPAALGRELKPIPSAEAGTTWYHGPSGTDLIAKRGMDGQYHRMTLYVQGSYVQWAQDGGVSTGRTRAGKEQGEVRGALRFETLWLDADVAPEAGKLAVAKTLILSSNLPEDFKNWCVRKLES